MSLRILLIFAIVHMKSYVVQSSMCTSFARDTWTIDTNGLITWEICYAAAVEGSFQYAVITDANHCYGTNTPPSDNNDNCQEKCSGNLNQECGGVGFTYISSTDIAADIPSDIPADIPADIITPDITPAVQLSVCYNALTPNAEKLMRYDVTPNKCCIEAKNRNLKYAVLGVSCYGTNEPPHKADSMPDLNCHYPCKSNPGEYCGTNTRAFIYIDTTTTCPTDLPYEGCYDITGMRMDSDGGGGSPNECIKHVSGLGSYNYAALNFKDQDSCTGLYDLSQNQVHESNCNRKCTNSYQVCGSSGNYASIYRAR